MENKHIVVIKGKKYIKKPAPDNKVCDYCAFWKHQCTFPRNKDSTTNTVCFIEDCIYVEEPKSNQ